MTTKILAKAIVDEAVQEGYADMFDETYNPEHMVNIRLTLEEVRYAARLINYKPSKDELENSAERHAWDGYIAEIDGVE